MDRKVFPPNLNEVSIDVKIDFFYSKRKMLDKFFYYLIG